MQDTPKTLNELINVIVDEPIVLEVILPDEIFLKPPIEYFNPWKLSVEDRKIMINIAEPYRNDPNREKVYHLLNFCYAECLMSTVEIEHLKSGEYYVNPIRFVASKVSFDQRSWLACYISSYSSFLQLISDTSILLRTYVENYKRIWLKNAPKVERPPFEDDPLMKIAMCLGHVKLMNDSFQNFKVYCLNHSKRCMVYAIADVLDYYLRILMIKVSSLKGHIMILESKPLSMHSLSLFIHTLDELDSFLSNREKEYVAWMVDVFIELTSIKQ